MSIPANEGQQQIPEGGEITFTYDFNVTPSGAVTVAAFDVTGRWVDVTNDVLADSAVSINGTVGTLPEFANGTRGHEYRLVVSVPVAGGGVELYHIDVVVTR